MTTLYIEASFRKAGELFLFQAEGISLKFDDKIVVETEHGPAIARVKKIYPAQYSPPPNIQLYRVLRLATPEDLERERKNREIEEKAFNFCREKIRELNLPMRLLRTEYFFDQSKLLFYFAAEGRIDFRDLVKILARHFQRRIEMRQIGVRDSAKLLGGIGICGQELCCSRFLRQFHTVSIRMVKDQNLPLNQQKVSGVCGRLMCCLAYEQSQYKEILERMPKVGEEIETPKGKGKVVELNPLLEKVKVALSDTDPPIEEVFHRSQLPKYSEMPLPDPPYPIFPESDQKEKKKKKRGLEPLMESEPLVPTKNSGKSKSKNSTATQKADPPTAQTAHVAQSDERLDRVPEISEPHTENGEKTAETSSGGGSPKTELSTKEGGEQRTSNKKRKKRNRKKKKNKKRALENKREGTTPNSNADGKESKSRELKAKDKSRRNERNGAKGAKGEPKGPANTGREDSKRKLRPLKNKRKKKSPPQNATGKKIKLRELPKKNAKNSEKTGDKNNTGGPPPKKDSKS